MAKEKVQLNLVEWAGKIAGIAGFFALMAYVSGFIKLFMFYKSTNSQWALSYHSFQEIAFQGVIDLCISSLVAVSLYFVFKTSTEVDTHGRRIVIWVWVGTVAAVFTAYGVGVEMGYGALDFLFLFSNFGAFGVVAAAVAKESEIKKTYKFLPLLFLAFVMFSIVASYNLYGRKDIGELVGEGRFDYAYSVDGYRGLLINAVGGRYLIRLCNAGNEFKLINRPDDWIIMPWRKGVCD